MYTTLDVLIDQLIKILCRMERIRNQLFRVKVEFRQIKWDEKWDHFGVDQLNETIKIGTNGDADEDHVQFHYHYVMITYQLFVNLLI